jgi:holliday junction DNA helicase RuvA
MLGYIEGKVITKNEDTHQCVIKLFRMGFEVTLTPRLFNSVQLDERVCVWLHTHVREDILALYGFGSEMERLLFRQLLGVSGLGPKTALSLLGEHGPERLVQLVLQKDSDEISSASGVGKKLAQRLVIELGGKIEKWGWLAKTAQTPTTKKETISPAPRLRDDLGSALINLGYLPGQVKSALDRVLADEELEASGFEACFRRALREISNRAFPAGEA